MRLATFSLLAAASTSALANSGVYEPPRLEDGRPDLQGFWVASNRTPLSRPADSTELRISAAQAKAIEDRLRGRDNDLSMPQESVEFLDVRQLEAVNGELRSSIIIAPADGKIPGTALLREKIERLRVVNRERMDGPEQRPLWERCIGSMASHPPMLAVGFTNMHQIVQTRAAVVFFSESLHEARIFRLNGKHPPAVIKSWLGDSIARWEGDTLVVETSDFMPDQNRMADFLISSDTVIVERFTRVSNEELNYVFTITDPLHYTQPWTGETHYLRSDDLIFEDACHEGNYSLQFILQGGRARDAASPPEDAPSSLDAARKE